MMTAPQRFEIDGSRSSAASSRRPEPKPSMRTRAPRSARAGRRRSSPSARDHRVAIIASSGDVTPSAYAVEPQANGAVTRVDPYPERCVGAAAKPASRGVCGQRGRLHPREAGRAASARSGRRRHGGSAGLRCDVEGGTSSSGPCEHGEPGAMSQAPSRPYVHHPPHRPAPPTRSPPRDSARATVAKDAQGGGRDVSRSTPARSSRASTVVQSRTAWASSAASAWRSPRRSEHGLCDCRLVEPGRPGEQRSPGLCPPLRAEQCRGYDSIPSVRR